MPTRQHSSALFNLYRFYLAKNSHRVYITYSLPLPHTYNLATTEGCDVLEYLQIIASYWRLYSYHLSYAFQIVHDHRSECLRVEIWSKNHDWLPHLLREFHEPDYFLLRINHDICHEQVGCRLHHISLLHGLIDVLIAVLYHAVFESLREIWREVARTEAVALDDLK